MTAQTPLMNLSSIPSDLIICFMDFLNPKDALALVQCNRTFYLKPQLWLALSTRTRKYWPLQSPPSDNIKLNDLRVSVRIAIQLEIKFSPGSTTSARWTTLRSPAHIANSAITSIWFIRNQAYVAYIINSRDFYVMEIASKRDCAKVELKWPVKNIKIYDDEEMIGLVYTTTSPAQSAPETLVTCNLSWPSLQVAPAEHRLATTHPQPQHVPFQIRGTFIDPTFAGCILVPYNEDGYISSNAGVYIRLARWRDGGSCCIKTTLQMEEGERRHISGIELSCIDNQILIFSEDADGIYVWTFELGNLTKYAETKNVDPYIPDSATLYVHSPDSPSSPLGRTWTAWSRAVLTDGRVGVISKSFQRNGRLVIISILSPVDSPHQPPGQGYFDRATFRIPLSHLNSQLGDPNSHLIARGRRLAIWGTTSLTWHSSYQPTMHLSLVKLPIDDTTLPDETSLCVTLIPTSASQRTRQSMKGDQPGNSTTAIAINETRGFVAIGGWNCVCCILDFDFDFDIMRLLNDLPHDLLLIISEFLHGEDCLTFIQCHRHIYAITNSRSFWLALLSRQRRRRPVPLSVVDTSKASIEQIRTGILQSLQVEKIFSTSRKPNNPTPLRTTILDTPDAGGRLRRHGPANWMWFLVDGIHVASIAEDRQFTLWNMKRQCVAWTFTIPGEITGGSQCFSNEGAFILAMVIEDELDDAPDDDVYTTSFIVWKWDVSGDKEPTKVVTRVEGSNHGTFASETYAGCITLKPLTEQLIITVVNWKTGVHFVIPTSVYNGRFGNHQIKRSPMMIENRRELILIHEEPLSALAMVFPLAQIPELVENKENDRIPVWHPDREIQLQYSQRSPGGFQDGKWDMWAMSLWDGRVGSVGCLGTSPTKLLTMSSFQIKDSKRTTFRRSLIYQWSTDKLAFSPEGESIMALPRTTSSILWAEKRKHNNTRSLDWLVLAQYPSEEDENEEDEFPVLEASQCHSEIAQQPCGEVLRIKMPSGVSNSDPVYSLALDDSRGRIGVGLKSGKILIWDFV